MTKAVVIIGDFLVQPTLNTDIYYFPNNITEFELSEEISDLKKFYTTLEFPTPWPPHLRKEILIQYKGG